MGATVPRPAPELLIKLTQGGEMRLSSLKGKVVGLEFVLTTCPHCQNSAKKVNALFNEIGYQGFVPVAVAVNEMSHMFVDEFVSKLGLKYKVGYQSHAAAVEFLQHQPDLQMWFPQYVLIDRKGVIRYQIDGKDKHFENEEKSLREKVLLLLKEGGTVPAKK